MEEYVWVSKLTHHPPFAGQVHPILMQAAARYGVRVTISGPRGTAAGGYAEAVRAALRRKVGGIMVVGWEDGEVGAAIDDAVDAGVPVVTVDSDVPSSGRLAYIGTDWYGMGRAMAEHLAGLLEGKGKVLLLGMAACHGIREGFRGFQERIADFSGIDILAAEDDTAEGCGRAEEITAAYLKKHPDLAGVAGLGGNSGPGAAAAVERAKKAGRVKIVCSDLDSSHFDHIRSGTIAAVFHQQREAFSYFAFQTLYSLNHRSAASTGCPGLTGILGDLNTGFLVIDGGNVETFTSVLDLDEAHCRFELYNRLGFFSEIVENVDEMVLAADREGRIVYVNPAGKRLTGFTEERLRGLGLDDLFELEYGRPRSIVDILAREEEGPLEGRTKGNGGRSCPVQIRISPLSTGERSRGFIIVAVDITARKRAEQRNDMILRSAMDGFWVMDRSGRILEVNDAYCRMIGYTREELLTMSVKDLEAVEIPEEVEEHSAAIQAQGAGRFETRHRRKDGSLVDLDASALYMDFEGGRFFTFFRDITERKRIDASLRESETFLFDVFTSIQDGISILDTDLNIISVNKAMEEWYAHEMPLKGKKCYRAYHGRGESCEVCPTRRTLESSGTSYEIVPRRGPGGKITGWFDLYSFPLFEKATGRIKGVIEYVRDITERRKAEEALRASEANYRAIFDASNDAVFVHHSETGEILDVNKKMCEIFEYTAEEARHLKVGDLSSGKPPYSQADALAKIRRAVREPQAFEWVCKTKSGRRFPVEVNLSPAVIGGKDRILAVVRDIEEKKRLEDDLRQSQKMEAVGRLAGGVAHDFNNLLTAIIGYSNVSMDEMPEDDPHHQSMSMINQAAKRAAALTRQLLAFSRKQVLVVKVLNLNEIIADMETMLKRLIGEDVEFETIFEESLWSVAADPNQIEQIVLNLAVNARDAMPRGGKLTIETANVNLDKVFERTHPGVKPGDYVLLAVSDTGQGMDAETHSHIFEPFFTTKPKGKGTGLGLAMVYGVVKQHQGTIEFMSEPGKGTRCKIYLPRVSKSKDAAEPRESKGQLQLVGSETVLIVEDEDLVRKVAKRILEMHGYTVLTASDPEEAFRICDSHAGEIQLLLTDVVMPQMDGRALFNRLRPIRRDMKVLYMSGYAEDAVVHHGTLDSDIQFLQKPFSVESLAAKVREVLDAPQKDHPPEADVD